MKSTALALWDPPLSYDLFVILPTYSSTVETARDSAKFKLQLAYCRRALLYDLLELGEDDYTSHITV